MIPWKACASLLLLALALSCARTPVLWQEVQLPTDARFNGVWFVDSQNGWMTGGARGVRGGLLGRTRDGGRTWSIRSQVVPGAGESYLGGVQFRDSLHGCALDGEGQVLLTSDGGENWRAVRTGRSSTDAMSHIVMLDERRGWAVGSATLIGTSDGGESWGDLVHNETDYLSGNAVAFTDALHGWLVGHGGLLMRSVDGGHTWAPVPLPLAAGSLPTLWDITFVDAANGWLVGEEGALFHTSDGGATWQAQTNGVPVERVLPRGEKPRRQDIVAGLDDGPSRLTLTAIQFADDERGFALGHYSDAGESVILGTRDGGATWQTERVAPGQFLHALYVLDRTHAWAVGDRERLLPQAIYRYAGRD